MMLERAGFEVIDLGVEVCAEAFVEAVKTRKPHIPEMSALLATAMMRMPEVIEALRQAELRNEARIMIGGAPVGQNFANGIGANGYAPDVAAAAKLAVRLREEYKSAVSCGWVYR